MIEFLLRNGHTWTPPAGDEDGEASASVIWELAENSGDDEAIARVARWINERIS
jgi:hypothetical protein